MVKLPKTDFNFKYKGNHTRFKHPEKTSKENISNFSTGNSNSKKSIVIDAKYSNCSDAVNQSYFY